MAGERRTIIGQIKTGAILGDGLLYLESNTILRKMAIQFV